MITTTEAGPVIIQAKVPSVRIKLNASQLLKIIGSTYYDRGEDYFRRGKVLEIDLTHSDQICGYVHGSKQQPYETTLYLNSRGNFSKGECSCAVGNNCKHVAALGLAVIDWLEQTGLTPIPKKSLEQQVLATRQELEHFIELPDTTPQTQGEAGVLIEVAQTKDYWDYKDYKTKKGFLSLRLRIFIRYSQTNTVSLTDLKWNDVDSSYRYRKKIVPETQYRFLAELSHTLGEQFGDHTWKFMTPNSSHHAVWLLLHQAETLGIVLRTGQKKDFYPVYLSQAEITPIFHVMDGNKEDLLLQKEWIIGDETLSPNKTIFLGGIPPSFALRFENPNKTVHKQPVYLHRVHALGLKSEKDKIQISPALKPWFQNEILPSLCKTYEVKNYSKIVKLPKIGSPKIIVHLGPGKKEQSVQAAFGFDYGGKFLPLDHQGKQLMSPGQSEPILMNPEKEAELKTQLKALLQQKGVLNPQTPMEKILEFEGLSAAHFMQSLEAAVKDQSEISIQKAEHLPEFHHETSEPEVAFEIKESSDSSDWFDLTVEVKLAGTSIPFQDLFTALAKNEEHLLLPDGRYFSLKQPVFEKLHQLIKEARQLREKEGAGLSLSRFQTGLFYELEQLGIIRKQSAAWQKTMEELRHLSKLPTISTPKMLKAQLRAYQKKGYRWLWFLYQAGLGGVLADDMGLGKTVQALAMMVQAKDNKTAKIPFLIVAPTTVVENWDTEITRFAPHFNAVIFRSGDRSNLLKTIKKADVVVTSYALIRRDFEQLKSCKWAAIILDEAQYLKNHQSKTYAQIRQLKTSVRFALTGTPMENNLMELWSVFSIVTPGLLGKPDFFNEHYRVPIERGQNQEKLATLKTRLRPFLMRRTKEKVAKDLPPKTEQILQVELTSKHRKVYDVFLQRERQKVLGMLNQGFKENRFQVLASLTKMRLLCLHTGLVEEKHNHLPSAKIDELKSRVETLVAEGHSVLIFSQFTSFLKKVREELDEQGLKYVYLDGTTRDRKSVIEQFKQKQALIFLISLKAGGTGLNLIEADYCFLLDPWWNPAVEAQATDRAHRIGQSKHVFVYKFIAKDTVEEKVLKLQEAKKRLFKSVLEEGGSFEAMITEKDIRAVFEL